MFSALGTLVWFELNDAHSPSAIRKISRNRQTGASLRPSSAVYPGMIRKLKSGDYRLYSRKMDPKTGKRRNLGTFDTLEKAKQHEREIQYFKRH